MMIKIVIAFSLVFGVLSSVSLAETVAVIPKPAKIVQREGSFELGASTVIVADENIVREAELLAEYLKVDQGFQLQVVKKIDRATNVINFRLDATQTNLGEEGYTLIVTPKTVTITGKTAAGVFYGCQSLRQLLPVEKEKREVAGKTLAIAALEITDKPRFQWRGYLLDEGRYFKGKAVVKDILDQMALLKMNVFHWHLTDDQGWRIEIKKYPKLTEIGSKRKDSQIGGWNSPKRSGKPHGGFYKQAEIREIVKYAAARHIRIMPEIEMPGHASSAVAAYPEVGVQRRQIEVLITFGIKPDSFNPVDEKTYKFLTDILTEVIGLFPSEVIHIGGDEVLFDIWQGSEEIQKFMKEQGITNIADVQTHFTNRISRFIEGKSRRMMGWNEIMGRDLHGFLNKENSEQKQKLATSAIIHFWKGDIKLARTAVEAGHDIVNSLHSFAYLDYGYDSISLKKAYSFDPIPEGLEKKYHDKVLGLTCNMWGEWIPQVKDLQRQSYPRIAAYAETGWSAKAGKDYDDFAERMKSMLKRWDVYGIAYAKINLETGK
ncbi:MAG: beta-N-acetylhexosaminidase [Sedimentisphaerales bacterium]|nr:beta-N-acetylhexosaminidase [Sedimentisphaerales bacterium]